MRPCGPTSGGTHHRPVTASDCFFPLVVHSLQLDIKTGKVAGKKFLEKRVLSTLAFYHLREVLFDGAIKETVQFAFPCGFLKKLP